MNEATAAPAAEPVRELALGPACVRLLGTAHVSRRSAEAVAREIEIGDYDCVAIELCPSRRQALADPAAWARLDLFQVIRQGKAPMVTATLALGAFQQRMAEQLGIEPGAEMRAAIEGAERRAIPLELIDREVGITLKRIYRKVPWWRRAYLFSALVTSVVTRHEVAAADIEKLKEGDLLESTFAQFEAEARDVYAPLIEERDRYMAARLEQLVAGGARKVLAVVGAGHLAGIAACLAQGSGAPPAAVIGALEAVPPPSRWVRALPWAVVVFVVAGIGLGFARSPELGFSLVREWVVYTGGLSAVGTAAAAGHPLTVVSALLGAPLTTLHPAIGIGFVTALVEAWVRRPTVGDFKRLRADTSHWSGWWRNRVARTLLVFVLSSLGAACGTYIAGFRIGSELLG